MSVESSINGEDHFICFFHVTSVAAKVFLTDTLKPENIGVTGTCMDLVSGPLFHPMKSEILSGKLKHFQHGTAARNHLLQIGKTSILIIVKFLQLSEYLSKPNLLVLVQSHSLAFTEKLNPDIISQNA